jgi:Glyoxalase-like domain
MERSLCVFRRSRRPVSSQPGSGARSARRIRQENDALDSLWPYNLAMGARNPWPIFCLCLLAVGVGCAPQEPPVAGVDHVPVAVADLPTAGERFRALGFTLKPGRAHDNSISNLHAKNADGTEIELITASEPRDALSRRYLHMIAAGEGAAFLALHGDLDVLEARLTKSRLAFSRHNGMIEILDPRIDYLFFDHDNHSPTDKPEYFVHANTSFAVIGVWLADEENPALHKLLEAVGAHFSYRDVLVPESFRAQVAELDGSEIILLPASKRLIEDRPIIGVVLQTANVLAATKLASQAHLLPLSFGQTTKYQSLFISPQNTHGVWLEFRRVY